MPKEINERDMDEVIIDAINEHTLPGVAVGVVRDGELVYSKGFGFADAKEQRPVTPDTVFRIGSISKTFTAIGLMQLWEEGKLGLDDAVNDYLKAFKIQHSDPNAPPVTFRHLLTHTSGIGELRSFADLLRVRSTFGLGAKEDEHVRLDEYYTEGLTPDTYPGEKWAYANHGFGALGQLVEEISGQPFEQYMIERVFEPLGMSHTDYLRSERVRDQLATGYGLKKGLLAAVNYQEIATRPAGSIFSSVNDMSKYVAALLNGGANEHGSVLKPETLQMMMERQFAVDERLAAMGLAFWLDSIAGHRVAWHGGGWPGFVSEMHVAPDDGLGAVVFCNGNGTAPYQIMTDLLRRLLDVREEALQLPRPGVLESPQLWEELCGFYGPQKGLLTNARTWIFLTGEAEVLVRDHHLALRSLVGPTWKGIRLYPVDPADPLVFEAEVMGLRVPFAFKRNGSGEIDQLCAGGLLGFTRFYKRPVRESIRFKARAASAGLAGLVATAAWRKLRKASTPPVP